MAGEYAFVMKDLRKVVPPKREILRGLWLSFFHGAKVGVLGANGAGKSTLLRIMAGGDRAFLGEAFPAAGGPLGSPPQEPQPAPRGERRRVALCRLLLSRPDMLLLDEPTNHLDAESVAWLERFLKEYPGTVVAITHDRYFLDNVAGWILELDRGHGIPWEGNYSSWLEQKHRRLEQEEKADLARRRTLERELEWVRMAPRARQAKGKARLSNYEALLAEASEQRVAALEIAIPPGPRLGDVVVEADHVTQAYGDRVLIDDLSFKLPRGGIVGVVGPNGAGKTTLFRMIVGQEKPDAGTLRVGETVKLAYVDQSRDALDPEKTVWEEISGGADTLALGGRTVPSRAYVASFNFKGSDQQKRVADLSGGERNRLHLATMLKRGANALLLDEPTNDLDVDTLRALEEALLDFAGCAVVISHDRWFLDRIATHILAFEDEGRAVWVEGSYSEYEADRKKRLGAEAARRTRPPPWRRRPPAGRGRPRPPPPPRRRRGSPSVRSRRGRPSRARLGRPPGRARSP